MPPEQRESDAREAREAEEAQRDVVPSNRRSFTQRGIGMGYTRLITRDQQHLPSYPWWAWLLAVISAIVGGVLFFRWVISL
jgi:hypothetical protein